MNQRIRKIIHDHKAILVVDYSDSKESEMISRVHALRDLIVKENKPVLLLSIFNDKSYATPPFVRAIEEATDQIAHLIHKQALTGLNHPKKMILKGYNNRFKRNIQNFDTLEQAIGFLADDNTTDKPLNEKQNSELKSR